MTRPDDNDPGTGGPPPEGERPGVVEGIKEELHHVAEEIHEVVEHVPKPVRWTIRRIVGLALLTLFALVVVAVVSVILYFARRTELVAHELTLVVNQTLAARSDVVLVIRDLKGNPLQGLRIVHPVLRFRDGDLPPVLEAEELRLRYSAWSLLTGGNGPIEVELKKPVIQLARGPDGKIRIPKWKTAGGTGGGKPRGLEFRVTIRDGKVQAPVLRPGINGLEARATARVGKGTQVDLQQLSWRAGPWGTPLERLRAQLDAGDSVHVRVLELTSPEVALSGRADWKNAGEEYRVHARVDRVRWAWLAKVFDNGVFDVPGAGSFEVDAVERGGWSGDFRASLTWDELTASGTGRFAYAGGKLAVAPLAAETPSGNVSGRFDMVGKRWVLEARAERVDPRAWKSFGLDGWPEGSLAGAFRMSQNEHHDFDLAAQLGASTLAGWRADSAVVWFHAPGATTDTFTVDFVRRGGRVRLEAGTRSWGWLGRYVARDFPLEEWPDGARSGLRGTLTEGRGDVVSRAGELAVTGDLRGQRSEWLGAAMHDWKLDGVRGRLLPTPDLEMSVRLSDLRFLGLHFDSTRAAVRLSDATATLDTVAAWAGDTLVRVAGNAAWRPEGWNLLLTRAEMASRHFHWTAEPPVTLRGDPRGVDFDRVVANDGDAHLVASGRWAASGGTYAFDATATRLDLSRLGLPDAWVLDGHADARLSVRGPNGDPRWSFEAECLRPGQRGHHADSLSIALEGSQHRLEVRRFGVTVGDGELDAAGRIEGTREAWPDTLTGDGVVRWLAGAASWQGAVHSRTVGLEGLDALLPAPIGWAGRLQGDLTLSGRPANPSFETTLEITPFVWKEFRMDRVGIEASLGDQRLRVAKLEMARGGVTSNVRGSLPIQLALGERVVLPEAPIDAVAQIPRGDLAILPAFVPQIGWSQGRFDLDATMSGTAQHPRLAGTMTVQGGSVRLAGREEVLNQLAARFRFDETRVTLDTLTAREGKDGLVRARGGIDLKGLRVSGYRFDLGLRNFSATEAGLYAALLDGDFVVTNGPKVRAAVLPQVVGQVNLRRAAVLFDFANQTETQQLAATTQPLYWTYRVKVEAARNLHWQPPDGDIEFSADLSLEQTADSLIIYGDLRRERGTYYFLSNRFTVNRADLTFDNESGVNPQLDIEAVARVVPSASPTAEVGSGNERPHDVTARITGRAAEPQVTFTSDPADWDEPRILRELTIGRFLDRNGLAIGDPLDHYLTRAINRTVSAEVSRAFKGYINEWVLEREQGGLLQGQGSLVLGVGTQLTPNLSLRYREALPGLATSTNNVGSLFQRQVEAEYRLSRFFYLTTELAQRRGITPTTALIGTDINVNLKARWEY